MYRSFADRMGFHWPENVAYAVREYSWRPLTWVTYDQLLQERRERQVKRLQLVRECAGQLRIAAYVWTFYTRGLGGVAYAGWHLYIWALKRDWWLHWEDPITVELMKMFPCGLLPIQQNFYCWKEAFGDTYSRPGRFKKQGLILGWVHLGRYNGRPQRFEVASFSESHVPYRHLSQEKRP